MCDTFTMVKHVSNVILESAKRKTIYEIIVLEPCHQSSELNDRNQHLLPFCPTRWYVKVMSLTKFLDNYRRVKKTLDEMLTGSIYIADDRKSKGICEKI